LKNIIYQENVNIIVINVKIGSVISLIVIGKEKN